MNEPGRENRLPEIEGSEDEGKRARREKKSMRWRAIEQE